MSELAVKAKDVRRTDVLIYEAALMNASGVTRVDGIPVKKIKRTPGHVTIYADMPGGGEVHRVYRLDETVYVKDRPAKTAAVSEIKAGDVKYDYASNEFAVDVSDGTTSCTVTLHVDGGGRIDGTEGPDPGKDTATRFIEAAKDAVRDFLVTDEIREMATGETVFQRPDEDED